MILFLGMLMPAEPALVLIVILESLYVDLPNVHDIALFFFFFANFEIVACFQPLFL